MDNNINNNNMKKNKQKFDHYFEVIINVVYITGFLAAYGFTVLTIIKTYS